VGLGIRFDGRSEGTMHPPPRLGADTEQVLREWAQMDDASIAQLRERHLI
jgi:crotonobetainyl-CoA:carnitine CoA-transferase CaiB-like acyl-CoA transferase